MSAGEVFGVITFLAHQVATEILLLYDVSDKFQELMRELLWTRVFLEDAEKKQRGEQEKLTRKWIVDVRDISYSLEDELEKFILVLEKHRQQNRVFRYAGIFNFLMKRHQIGTSIDRLQKEIKIISESRSKYGLESRSEYGLEILEETNRRNEFENEDLRWQRRANALEEESSFVGLENDLKVLKDRLLGTEEKRRCCISVVGMGGLGKTTIARKVYADVERYFDCSAWVYISQEFNIKDVLEKIMKDITGKDEIIKDEEKLKCEINKLLKGKRYLVVLDDVWNNWLWLNLRSVFPDDNNGSRLLLTTRNEKVARHVDPVTSPHRLRPLDEYESWELFRQKTRLVPGEDPEVLFDLGRKITEKCGGFPLAIIVLGGLLSRRPKQVDSWKIVLNHISLAWNDSPERCQDILAMSYYDLPFRMKPCFLYFALFPEDSDIPAKTLIHCWVAEHLVEASQIEKLEDAAQGYLQELISRSLVQVAEREPSGKLKFCRIQNVLRDLAIKEAWKDNFLHTRVSEVAVNNVHRLSIQSEVPLERENFEIYSNLRSLFLMSPISMSVLKELIPKMHLLRVLDITLFAEKIDLVLLKEINQLIHLRYLRIEKSYKDNGSERFSPIICSKPYLSKLPPTLSNLKYLQTLNFGFEFVNMSHSIWSLCRLRHLYGRNLSIVGDAGDEKIDRLKNLQTLQLKAGNWINGGLENLSNLRDLRIYKSLSRYHKVISKALRNLFKLRVLELDVEDGSPFLQLPSLSHLQCLTLMHLRGPMMLPAEFPPNLVELLLMYLRIEMWNDLLVTLQNLKELKCLTLCELNSQNCEFHFSSKGFSKLEKLDISVGTLNIEEGALRRLKWLGITQSNIEHIPHALESMGCLRELKLASVSSELLDRLESGGEDWQKIKHVTSIKVSYNIQNSNGHFEVSRFLIPN